MPNLKLQASGALKVIPSNTIDIPNPSEVVVSSTTTGTTASKLVDTSVDFTANGTVPGAIIYNTSDGTVATVIAIDSATVLSISADIMAVLEEYTIYPEPTTDCLLYVGGAGDLEVLTTGGDRVTFFGMLAGTFVPVHVKRVFTDETTATNIVALW